MKPEVTLTYLDSRHPGRIRLSLRRAPTAMPAWAHDMTVQEAAELSERLADAVRRSGYDMVARRRRETRG